MTSNDCFKQLPIELNQRYPLEDLKYSVHMVHDRWQKYGVALKKKVDYDPAIATTYFVSSNVKDSILAIIPKGLLQIEYPEVWYLEVSGGDGGKPSIVPPHIDRFRKTVINFYLATNKETTTFYQYSDSSVDVIAEFSSGNNECWVLNTDQPHSVSMIPGKSRAIVSISFIHTPYSEVIKWFM